MKYFLIHGYEQTHGGANGAENFEVIDLSNEDRAEIGHELELIGEQLSLDVMESNPEIMQNLKEVAKERFENPVGDDEGLDFEDILEDVQMDNVDFKTYQLPDKMDSYTLEDLVNMDPLVLISEAKLLSELR